MTFPGALRSVAVSRLGSQTSQEPTMEIVVIASFLLLLAILAPRFGYDSSRETYSADRSSTAHPLS